jgi:hypothetical protein
MDMIANRRRELQTGSLGEGIADYRRHAPPYC